MTTTPTDGSAPATMQGTSDPLARLFDVALLDLDGVVYIGPDAVPGVPAALSQARSAGMRLAFVTNNAARPPKAVAEHLTELGIHAQADEVINSSQAAAHYLADRLPGGAKVLVVGTVGLHEALRERGLEPVTSADEGPSAVVQGYSPTLSWNDLAEGAVAIRSGVPWVATNLDPTVPSPRGPLPGNGSLVAALRHATGVTPIVTGKPEPTMHRESVERSGAQRPIVVGDRLDTDIEGSNAVGCPSLLVLSGVTGPADLLAAGRLQRPTYLGHDVSALLYRHTAAEPIEGGWECGAWQVRVLPDAVLHLVSARERPALFTADDDLDSLRALCAAAWSQSPDARTDWRLSSADEAAADELARYSLT